MSMTLKKVELWNIKSHEHFLFEPDLKGITSVSGVNGAGKSTIVDSFAWTLFGTKANNIKNKMLIREGVDAKTEVVQSEVEVTIDKIDYLIRRRIISAGGGTECNIYGRTDINGEYNHLAGPAVKSAETFVRQVLKMDEKGFLTAILIQQKQVDEIVLASPRERGQVIEKLTGIQSITNGINMAREEARTYQKSASVITVEDVDSLKTVIQEEVDNGKLLKQEIESLEAELKTEKEVIIAERSIYSTAEEGNIQNKDLNQKIELNKERVKMLNSESKTLMEVIGDYKKENKTTVVEDIKELEKSLDKANKELSTVESSLNFDKNKVSKNADRIAKLEKGLTISIDESKQKIAEVDESIATSNKTIEDAKSEAQGIKGQAVQVTKSLETLNGEDTECPVCKTHIDDPEELKKEIQSELNTFKVRLEELKGIVSDEKKSLDTLNKERNKLSKVEVLYNELDELTKENQELEAGLSDKEDKVNDLSAKAKLINVHYKEALLVAAKADEINRAKVRIEEINTSLKTIKDETKTMKESLKQMSSVGDRELASMRNALGEKEKAWNTKHLDFNSKNERLKFLRSRVEDLKKQYSSAKVAKDKYEYLISSMKEATVASSLLSEFKEERIKYSIPALEMYASTVLSKFTEGKFIKLNLDSKFQTFVTTEKGQVRPITQLSGGELSAAAIALRIGISMLLNEGESNVLIMDEILVSMDENRARHIIETISTMINCQVIFIAHNADIQEVADKNVRVG